MNIDSYDKADAEELLRSAEERYATHSSRRLAILTEGISAATILAAAVLIAAFTTSTRSSSIGTIVVFVLAYLAAERVKFPVGSAWTAPTQLVFVPMLFVLPMSLVPLIVVACSVGDLLPSLLKKTLSVDRLLARIGDSAYSLGPVLVLVFGGGQEFSWHRWPLLLAAFGTQIACDAGWGLGRTWFAERIRPSVQLPMVWIYLTDGSLSCVGVAIAASAVTRPGLVLLTLPLMGFLSQFARERKQRLESTLALSTASRGTALLLGDVIESDDHYTGIHSREVVDLSLKLADALRLDAETRRNVEYTALLHDVGKIRVPAEIINKADKLDEREWEIIRRHTIDGEAMLRQVGGMLAGIGRFVRSSHERFDGGGYPDGLAAEEIPIESRIVSVCDAYNAMVTDRAYRPAMCVSDALAELERGAGTQFDPRAVAAVKPLVWERISPATRGATPRAAVVRSVVLSR
ncbi:MAG TPA: HD-GYP domain-containing protein [Solirubrobacteraceae bacterium]|jgi:HD-GYP domain-containing protein (c-di-GMP phosphodiesterase class II)